MKLRSVTARLLMIALLNSVQVIGEQLAYSQAVDARDFTTNIQVIPAVPTINSKAIAQPNVALQKTITFTEPNVINLPVPFFAQAPKGDWSAPFQEACEEMSLLLVQAYLQNIVWNTETISQEVHKLTAWVKANGYGESITVEQLARIAKEYANLESSVLYNPTVVQIENLIKAGYPVLLPLAGRKLQNPYFVGEGPQYHMVVVTGFNEQNFITKEVGTQFGDNYQYPKQLLLDSIHNFTGDPNTITQGAKAILVLANI